MTNRMVVVERRFSVPAHDSETLHARAEAVMAQLVELSDAGTILDSAVSADSECNAVIIQVTTRGDDLDEGIAAAMSAMRAAIHAVGDGTPRWPSHDQAMELTAHGMNAELVEA